jgi:hypothetical protein
MTEPVSPATTQSTGSTLPTAVQAAVATGKPVLRLTGEDDRSYYFHKPGKLEVERFIGTATKGKAVQAAKNLVLELAIFPTSDELLKEYQEHPGRMVALNNALQASVGMNEDFVTKKL